VRDDDSRPCRIFLVELFDDVRNLGLDGDIQRRGGSSGMISRGLQATAMAIITRWRIAARKIGAGTGSAAAWLRGCPRAPAGLGILAAWRSLMPR